VQYLTDIEFKPSVFTADDFLKLRSIGNINKYRKHETIFFPESPYRFIYVLNRGKVKVYRISRRGKETIIRILQPYDLFGEYAVLGDYQSRESVEAMEECELLLISRNDFMQVITTDSDLLMKFNRMLLERNYDLETYLADLSFRDVHVRMIKKLVELARKFGKPSNDGLVIDIKITQYELGNLIGATRETTSTVLNGFRRDGLINFNGRKIIISDLDALLERVSDDEVTLEEEEEKESNKTS
jgi:CRP/FNR family transcriptional regulator